MKISKGTGVAAVALMALGLAACADDATTSSPSGNADKTLQLAYLSFAVANSYDAPMLAAAKAVASANNAVLTVFDANNDPNTQFSQFQNAISAGKYDGIIVQPILGSALVPLAQQAIQQGIQVVNIDQILGPDYTTDAAQVDGLAANVVFNPTKIGTQMGDLTVQACQGISPCTVGYMFDIKASGLDIAINKAFTDEIAKTPGISVVAEGEDFFTPALGLTAAQNMLQAHPDLNVIVASDQGIEGTVQALGDSTSVKLVGFGASAAGLGYLKAGKLVGDVAQAPASEGQFGTQALITVLRGGSPGGVINPVGQLPNDGVVTPANVDQFTAEWNG